MQGSLRTSGGKLKCYGTSSASIYHFEYQLLMFSRAFLSGLFNLIKF